VAIRVALHHTTTYQFDRLVALSPHSIRLRPAPHCRTPILSYALSIQPQQHFLNWQQDPQGNYLARVVFPEPTRALEVVVDLVADLVVINPFDFFLEPSAEIYPFFYEPWLQQELTPYLEPEPAGPQLQAFLDTVSRQPEKIVAFLVRLNQQLQREIQYIIRLEPGIQSCEETLTWRRGSCRDSAWLLVQILRHLGLAARFVSGYLIQLVADVKPLEGPAGPVQDFTDLHAWAEVYLPGAGWVGLDPTSGLFAGEGHIPLACTPHASSAAPITGRVDKCEVEFHFTMSVSRIHEDPRVTKPYTEAQWQAIDALGQRIDAELLSGDVRLTMGGEPTFVSIDDMEGVEWNTAALGPTKRHLAAALLKRLKARFAPEGFLHYGEGKWYPGESLPRWALACYWRQDSVPLWQDDTLIAAETVDYGHGASEARQFIETLAGYLGVEAQFIMPAYEDTWHFLSEEQRLPVNVDPLQVDLHTPEERLRLARTLGQGLGRIVGYVLPLECRRFSPARWVTGPWEFRPGYLLLLPGDSPIGLRLPLDALPWIEPASYPYVYALDPFAPREPLTARSRPPLQPHLPGTSDEPRLAGMREQILPDAPSAAAAVVVSATAPLPPPGNGSQPPSRLRLPGGSGQRYPYCPVY
jgi:transglutaminase-like putative cysteine protease